MGTERTLTSPNLITSILAVILAAGSLTLAPMAMAEPVSAQPTATAVSYSDLDLSTEAGARTVLQRINAAARTACGSEPVHSPLFPRAVTQFQTCVSQAVETAVDGIDAPVVLAFHKAGASEPPTTIALR